jgi:hypothetical protein
MNHLLREIAPVTDVGWQLLDSEAKDRLMPALAARKLVDFSGPRGWEHSATNLGRTEPVPTAPADGVSGLRRRVLPLVELRADFTVSLAVRTTSTSASSTPRRTGSRLPRTSPSFMAGRARSPALPKRRHRSRSRSGIPATATRTP